MGKREVNTSAEARLIADFIDKHLARGTGNHGQRQTAASLAARAGLAPSTISELRNRMASLPGEYTLGALERGFFPGKPVSPNDPAYVEWQEVRRAVTHAGLPTAPGFDDKRYTMREAWDLLMRPLADRVIPIVRSAPVGSGAGILHGRNIDAQLVSDRFILPMPDWFSDAVRGDEALRTRYDIHQPVDFAGNPDLSHFYDSVPVPNFRAIVAYHAEAQAHAVMAALKQRSAYPPYNKKKLGLHGYQQSQRAGLEEGTYLDLDFFETDYHTHRAMKRVLHDLRASSPELFREDSDPYGALPWLPYFTTSFGINIVVTTKEESGRRFYMTRLSARQGNVNQQGLWHITVNEGVNFEDVRDGRIDMTAIVARALEEEVGAPYTEPADETVWLEFAIDHRNLEPFLSCVVHLAADRETFYRRKQHLARDDRREFQEMRDFPFTEEAIVRLLLDDARGSSAFTSYGLNILDSLLVRGAVTR